MEIFSSTATFTDYESYVLLHSSEAHLKTYLFLGMVPHLVFPYITLERELSMVAWRSSKANEIFSLALIRHPILTVKPNPWETSTPNFQLGLLKCSFIHSFALLPGQITSIQ